MLNGMFHQLHAEDEHGDSGKKLPQIVIGGFQIDLKLKYTNPEIKKRGVVSFAKYYVN